MQFAAGLGGRWRAESFAVMHAADVAEEDVGRASTVRPGHLGAGLNKGLLSHQCQLPASFGCAVLQEGEHRLAQVVISEHLIHCLRFGVHDPELGSNL